MERGDDAIAKREPAAEMVEQVRRRIETLSNEADREFTRGDELVQAEHDLGEDLTLAGSARWDAHDEYGSYFSPRVSVLYRPGPWTFRASLGRGFYAPTPFVEEIEATGLSRLEPLGKLKAETAKSASLEGGYAAGPIEANLTLFASDISNAIQLQTLEPQGRVRLVNAGGDTRTRGAEALLRYRWNDLTITGSYVYVDATEPDPRGPGRRTIPLTPRHTAGVVAMWEQHGKGRIGVEAYYTGRQELEDNPYRREGRPYLEVGLLGELFFGKTSVFLNLENLLNVRQTKYDPMMLPRRAPDGRWPGAGSKGCADRAWAVRYRSPRFRPKARAVVRSLRPWPSLYLYLYLHRCRRVYPGLHHSSNWPRHVGRLL